MRRWERTESMSPRGLIRRFPVLAIRDFRLLLADRLIAPASVFALSGGVAADRFRPQRVIVAANLLMALGEGTFGILVLTGHPPLWAMMGLEAVTGTGIAIFYRASQALLPPLVPWALLQEASAISRLVRNP